MSREDQLVGIESSTSNNDQIVLLSTVHSGIYKIIKIASNGSVQLRQRLFELGFCTGTVIDVQKRGTLFEIGIRKSRFLFRKDEVNLIYVRMFEGEVK